MILDKRLSDVQAAFGENISRQFGAFSKRLQGIDMLQDENTKQFYCSENMHVPITIL